jgi:hypothetical protein
MAMSRSLPKPQNFSLLTRAPAFAGNVRGAVAAEGLDDDDFVDPPDASHHGTDLPGFVEGHGVGGDLKWSRHVGIDGLTMSA